ncbi:enoyl-CoA hydratase/isomerase family protein [Biformimicrobium ophioploci]|uniref:3-hydroxyisobutyryl-CoA hydrolase n=1 Tax=Biformimicrobium ophioploci TaxID=3036711 RepID=A0ABQ6M205_9GAMM|nr:enoyl-CoA hydratase/isomerase family protein [Microbulbifer sp. NKW57]GMG88358.1 enoyl-CoA hydratase/isomerase family protein [Microbulbifer sp. NKW57]
MMENVITEVRVADQGAVGVITLNSEKTLNSLTLDMVREFTSCLNDWQTDDNIAAVFLQGAGEKALCAGGDIQELYRSASGTTSGPCVYAETFFEEEYRLDYLIHTYTKPLICWGHGIVMGGGLGLMAGASHRVGTEKTRIAMPEITIGLYPDVGGTYFLNRMPHRIGLFLGLTASSINLTDALYTGLVSHAAHAAQREAFLTSLCQQAWRPGNQKEANSSIIDEVLSAHALTELPQGNLEGMAVAIEAACSQQTLEEIIDAIDALEGDSPWLDKAKAALKAGSPLSARLIHEQLERCQGLDLAAVFKAEMLLSTRIVRNREFSEGVRALLIDKDNQPNWQFQRIADIPEELVEQFFTPPWATNPLYDL